MPHTRIAKFRHRANASLLVLAFAVILITSFVSVFSIRSLEDAIDSIRHTLKVKETASHLQYQTWLMETSGMRYMIDGSADHRDAHRRNLAQMGALIAELKSLTVDNPVQTTAIAELVSLHAVVVERSAKSMALKQRAIGKDDELGPVLRLRDGEGEKIMLDLRGLITRIIEEEDRLLRERGRERDALVKQTNATLLIANGLALVAGILGFFAIRRAQRELENNLLIELKAMQAKRASEEKSHFLANMSHEIRTPMNAIFGFSALLGDRVVEPQHREWLTSIRKSADILMNLINDVLDLSKIEAGKLSLNRTPTDVVALAAETTALFRPQAVEKGLDLRFEPDTENTDAVLVDAQRLRQILMNLLGNAVKYTDHGAVVLRLSMLPSPLGGRDLRIVVVDTGIGIPADQLDMIFEPFHQADNPDGKVRPGTGLGLSITRRLVGLMNGRIDVESRVGQGTTFQVHLPDLAIASSQPEAAAIDDSPADFDRIAPLRILIVDDIAWNIEVARGYLEGSRHRIAIARDGEEALTRARETPPDVILMDLRMPKMDGYRAREAIRADAALVRIPIVAVTASSLEDEEQMRSNGFDGFVRKPYTSQQLFAALHALFGDERTTATQDSYAPTAPTRAEPASAAFAANGSAPTERSPHDDAQARACLRALLGEPLRTQRRAMRFKDIADYAVALIDAAAIVGDEDMVLHARALRRAALGFELTAVKRELDALIARRGDEPSASDS